MCQKTFALIVVLLAVAMGGCAPQEQQNSQGKQTFIDDAKPQAPREQDARLSHSLPPPPPVAEDEKQVLNQRPAPYPTTPATATIPMLADGNITRGGMGNQPESAESKPSDKSEVDRENYQRLEDSPTKDVKKQPVSTFSIDVDTGSYSNVRRMLKGGLLPRKMRCGLKS